ncbi:hypothetical protein [Micromonospora sp. NPDC049801]|uniref:hypothetical protein n=1 Tax=unclassified Micromonospora TaxID=2617518 RepID=UPI0033FB18ED
MTEPKSRDTGAQEPPTQPRERVDGQRNAGDGAESAVPSENRGVGAGPTDAEPGERPLAPESGAHGLPQPAGGRSSKTMSDPDVVLQIPQVKVEQIYVEVDDLDTSVSLRARLGSLLQLDVGVQAHLGTVKVDIKGVEAEAMLEVRLDELRGILDSALRTIERNPQIIESLVKTVDNAVNEVGQTVQEALGPDGPLSQTLQQATQQVGQQLGQATQQLGQSTQQRAQSSGTVAGGGVGGLGGVLGGSPAHASWQRMKKIINSSQPLRQVTRWLGGPQGQQPPS